MERILLPPTTTLQELHDALNTAFVLETNAFSCVTSRLGIDRTRFRSDTHFHRSLTRAVQLLKLSRGEQDELILEAYRQRQQQLRELTAPPPAAATKAANTAELLSLLKGSKT